QGGAPDRPGALPHPDQRQERQQRRVQVGTGAQVDRVHRDRQLVHAQGCPWNIRYATYPAAQATIPNPANSRIKNTVCNTPGTIPGRPAGARSEATAREPHSGEQLRNGPSAEPSNRTQRGDSEEAAQGRPQRNPTLELPGGPSDGPSTEPSDRTQRSDRARASRDRPQRNSTAELAGDPTPEPSDRTRR